MVALRANCHSIRFPLFRFLVEIGTRRRVETKFIIRSEMQLLISEGRRSDDRGGTHVSGIQFSKTEDQRTMSEGLIVREEMSVNTLIDRRRAEERPTIDRGERTVQDRRTIESINHQVGKIHRRQGTNF